MKPSFIDLPDEPGTTYASFTEATMADAESVVRAAFDETAVPLLGKILANPLRSELPAGETGDLVYFNGLPVGFEALLPRRLYLGQRPLLGMAGSTMGLKPGVSPLALLSLMKRNLTPRQGSVLWFANTANTTSVKMNRKLCVRGKGPTTWESSNYAIIHPLRFAWMVIKRKVFKCEGCSRFGVAIPVREEPILRAHDIEVRRLTGISPQIFDGFWARYLASNTGLVSSRSSGELAWMFGETIASGRDIVLGAFAADQLVGYIIVRGDAGGWWRVVDLIADRNSEDILTTLLRAAKRFLRKRTRAVLVQAKGFPTFACPVLRQELKLSRPVGGNTFLWQFTDEALARAVGDLTTSCEGWFFGPYDGDWCL